MFPNDTKVIQSFQNIVLEFRDKIPFSNRDLDPDKYEDEDDADAMIYEISYYLQYILAKQQIYLEIFEDVEYTYIIHYIHYIPHVEWNLGNNSIFYLDDYENIYYLSKYNNEYILIK